MSWGRLFQEWLRREETGGKDPTSLIRCTAGSCPAPAAVRRLAAAPVVTPLGQPTRPGRMRAVAPPPIGAPAAMRPGYAAPWCSMRRASSGPRVPPERESEYSSPNTRSSKALLTFSSSPPPLYSAGGCCSQLSLDSSRDPAASARASRAACLQAGVARHKPVGRRRSLSTQASASRHRLFQRHDRRPQFRQMHRSDRHSPRGNRRVGIRRHRPLGRLVRGL